MTIADEFEEFFNSHPEKPGSFALTLARWMAERDPKGYGKLDKIGGLLHFSFSDHSKVSIDITTGDITRLQ